MVIIDKLKKDKDPIISSWAKVWDSYSYRRVTVPFKSKRLIKIVGIEKDTDLRITIKIERRWYLIWLTYVTLSVKNSFDEECLNVIHGAFQGSYNYRKNSDLPILKKIYDAIPRN